MGAKDAEVEKLKAEMDKKVDVADLPGAVAAAVRDLPYEMVSVYKDYWTTRDATITYDSYLSDYNNSERPGGGDGSLDLSTGTFTCLTSGHYTVTYSGYSGLDPGEGNNIYLSVNGVMVAKSRYDEHAPPGISGRIVTQGSRSLILHLGLGDTLQLRTYSNFNGEFYDLIWNISLTAPDSLDSRTTNTTRTHFAP